MQREEFNETLEVINIDLWWKNDWIRQTKKGKKVVDPRNYEFDKVRRVRESRRQCGIAGYVVRAVSNWTLLYCVRARCTRDISI